MRSLSVGIYRHFGSVFFLFYFLFCAIYYQERTLFLDNAFQTFLMIVEGDIAINADRWPAIVVRFLPFFLIKLHVSLKGVLFAFSLSYALYHFLIFYWLRYRLGNTTLSFLLIAMLSYPVVHSFFWCNSELNLGISLLILCMALILDNKHFMASVLSIVLLWMHPLIVLPYALVMVYYFLLPQGNRLYRIDRKIAAYYGSGFVSLYLLKGHFLPNWYDTMKSDVFNSNLEKYDFFQYQFIVDFFTDNYFIFPLSVVATVALLLFYKRITHLLLFLTFIMSYLIILDISSYSSSIALDFYNEVNLGIVFFASAFFIINAEFEWTKSQVKLLLCTSMIFVFYHWCLLSHFYSNRIDWFETFANENDRKIIPAIEVDHSILIMPWASAYESLLISTLNGPSKTVLVTQGQGEFETENSQEYFYAEFKNYKVEIIDSLYFQLEKKGYSIHN